MTGKRTYRHEYRVILQVPEDGEWEAQEIISGKVWGTPEEAQAEIDVPLDQRWPQGCTRYIESRSISEWGKHG